MADSDIGPMFRANKRRKVFRKRPDDNDDDISPANTTIQDPQHNNTKTAESTDTMKNLDNDNDISKPGVPRPRRPKNYGIAFSSSDRPPTRPQENALVVAESQPAYPQINRFTRQTGKAVVEDDKHMSAYIESKLAEMRAAALTNTTTSHESDNALETQHPDDPTLDPESPGKDPALPTSSNPPPAHTKPNQPPKPRRGKKKNRAPSPSTQARASLIDEIMHESNHNPHYNPHYTAKQAADEEANADPDAAAAEAYKARFLAHAEARNLSRRKPAPKKASAAPAAPNLSGPKLGGSRAARSKMRAAYREGEGK